MKSVINGRVYNTETATKIATNIYWDGNNWDRHGRSTCLYKTSKGNYFIHFQTRWQGERNRIRPVTKEEAMEIWDELPEKEVEYVVAFDVEPEEA